MIRYNGDKDQTIFSGISPTSISWHDQISFLSLLLPAGCQMNQEEQIISDTDPIVDDGDLFFRLRTRRSLAEMDSSLSCPCPKSIKGAWCNLIFIGSYLLEEGMDRKKWIIPPMNPGNKPPSNNGKKATRAGRSLPENHEVSWICLLLSDVKNVFLQRGFP